MKSRPVLFSGPMVRALLDGTKTQTRRVLKPQPTGFLGGPGIMHTDGTPCEMVPVDDTSGPFGKVITCPYGKRGDQLWVREAWKAHTTFDALPPRDIPKSHVWYMADDGYKAESRYRQSMHMPRWASRITLEITGVRVERLQNISEADALAEGVSDTGAKILDSVANEVTGPIAEYSVLWESINGPGSWDLNPWVWVVEFRRLS